MRKIAGCNLCFRKVLREANYAATAEKNNNRADKVGFNDFGTEILHCSASLWGSFTKPNHTNSVHTQNSYFLLHYSKQSDFCDWLSL